MPDHDIRERSPAAVGAELDRYTLLDVREGFELDGPLGHVAGAVRIDRSALPDRAPSLRGAALLVICRSGRRSAAACQTLLEHDVQDVTNLEGGMIAWHAAGLPIERTPPADARAFADLLARWASMLSQTPLDEVLGRWPALRSGDSGAAEKAGLEDALGSIEASFREAGAPPDLDLSLSAFRQDLADLPDA